MERDLAKFMNMDTNERQRRYVESQKARGTSIGIVFADAFLRGIRDLGYKNPAWALAEMIDNSIQATATDVAVFFGFNPANSSRAKPDHLAIADNGAGMIPEMITYSVMWGGTDREDDRAGFGRYGYGLPSSAVSLAKRYTVYSKAAGAQWHAVTVDIEELADAANDKAKTEKLLAAKARDLPVWVLEATDGLNVSMLESGTVVVLEDLDRLRRMQGWITGKILEQKLLQLLGTIYRHWIPSRRISVNGVAVEPVDPLFLMEHARYYNENSAKAQRVDARAFEVETSDGLKGAVTIRAAVLPPNFQLADPKEYGKKGAKLLRGRWDVMRAYNGLIVCREGRQIDCISPRWTKFQNYDANIKIEINFDPMLDEFFGITTSKQQIVIDDEMWEKLEHSGKNGGDLRGLVKSMRSDFEGMQTALLAQFENAAGKEEPRASELAMEASEKFVVTTPLLSATKLNEADRNLKLAATEISKVTGKPEAAAIEQLIEETRRRRWELEFRVVEEGPFYQPRVIGEQKRVILNTEHPFYTRIYTAAPEARSALEVLLFVLADAELRAEGEKETFYKAARQEWSERLRYALERLSPDGTLADKASRVAEEMHVYMNSTPSEE